MLIPFGVALLGVGGAWAIQVFFGLYTAGRLVERLNRAVRDIERQDHTIDELNRWMGEAAPQIEHHEHRISTLERRR